MNPIQERDIESAPFTEKDHDLLKQCEVTIEQGVKHFLAVGQALHTIRSKRLYHIEGYKSFNVYCLEKWNITRQHADRLIYTFTLSEELKPRGVKIEDEKTARKYRSLEPEEQEEAIKSGNIKEAIKQFSEKEKSDYLLIRGYANRIGEILIKTSEDPDRIWDALAPILDWMDNDAKRIERLANDAEFDVNEKVAA